MYIDIVSFRSITPANKLSYIYRKRQKELIVVILIYKEIYYPLPLFSQYGIPYLHARSPLSILSRILLSVPYTTSLSAPRTTLLTTPYTTLLTTPYTTLLTTPYTTLLTTPYTTLLTTTYTTRAIRYSTSEQIYNIGSGRTKRAYRRLPAALGLRYQKIQYIRTGG